MQSLKKIDVVAFFVCFLFVCLFLLLLLYTHALPLRSEPFQVCLAGT